METSQSVFAKLAANYTSVYVYLGIMTPFWAIWLKYKGLSPSEIGIIIAIPYLLKLIVSPLISQTSDKRQEYRRPLILCVTSSVVFTALYYFAEGFWQLLIVTMLVNLTLPAVMPLMETIAVAQSGKHRLSYGQIRSFGSVSFIVAAIVVGWIIKTSEVSIVLIFVLLSLVLLLISALLLPRGNKTTTTIGPATNSSPIKNLLANKDFVWFLIVVGLLQASHGVYYSMGSIYWQEGGIGEDVIGMLWAVGVIAEVSFFVFCGSFIQKYPLSLIFAIIGFFGTLRWVVLSVSMSLPIIFVAQILHALTFGASHLVAIQYLGSRITKETAGTAQSLYSSLPLGLIMGLSTYVGGIIYEYEAGGSYLAMAVMCFTAFIMAIFRFYRKK